MVSAQKTSRLLKERKNQYSSNYSKNETKGIAPYLFYEVIVTVIPKPHKDWTKRELQTNLLYEYRCREIVQK